MPFSGGLNFDWYQPAHENGNILSYPPVTSQTFTPSDLGPFTLPDGTEVTDLLVPASLLGWDGTSGTIALTFSQQSGGGGTRSSSHKFQSSLDVKVAVTAKAAFFGSKEEASASYGFNVHGGFNIASLDTTDSTTNTSTGITLNRAPGNSNQAYTFAPVFYYTQDGTIKAAHAVDVLGSASGRSFWVNHYGQKPDPALNLPLRFTITNLSSNTWGPNPDSSRKQLRGFFLRQPTLNPATNDYDYLSAASTAGDTVRIEVNVYNYSVSQRFSNCLVRFYAVPYDSTTDRESASRTQIGETVVSLNPLDMTPAVLEWDTTGFGPTQSGDLSSYRIYVVLDPENEIDEIYETDTTGFGANSSTCADPVSSGTASCNPGQNNEGWGLISIAAPDTVSLAYCASPTGPANWCTTASGCCCRCG